MAPTSIPIRSMITTSSRHFHTARDTTNAPVTSNIGATVGVVLGAIAVSSTILFFIVRHLHRRRRMDQAPQQQQQKTPAAAGGTHARSKSSTTAAAAASATMGLRYALKHPRKWYRRHNSVNEILRDEELARITQIRKSLQGRSSSRNSQISQSSQATTASDATTAATSVGSASDFSSTAPTTVQVEAEVLDSEGKVWESARVQSPPPLSVRDLEAQGHPAFASRRPSLLESESGIAVTTDEKGASIPKQPGHESPDALQPPSPARMVDEEPKRRTSQPSWPPPYREPQAWPLAPQ